MRVRPLARTASVPEAIPRLSSTRQRTMRDQLSAELMPVVRVELIVHIVRQGGRVLLRHAIADHPHTKVRLSLVQDEKLRSIRAEPRNRAEARNKSIQVSVVERTRIYI